MLSILGMGKNVIQVKNLRKKFGNIKAVDNVSFAVKKGEILAMLGPNGAGKTTTLEMVEGILKQTSGTIDVLGFNPARQPQEVKRRIGIQLQSTAYYEYLNLGELLDLFGSFFRKKVSVKNLLKMVGLEEKRKAKIGELSGGQKQRFSVVATLVNDPEIVFLDEPTTGLDPQARRNLWGVVRKINRKGKTIILTTHYMEEADILADKVLIMDRGKIIASGTPKQLKSKLPNPFRIELITGRCPGDIGVRGLPGVVGVRHDKDEQGRHRCIVGVKDVRKTLPNILAILKKKKVEFSDLEVIPSNLEDVFLNLTGKELRD